MQKQIGIHKFVFLVLLTLGIPPLWSQTTLSGQVFDDQHTSLSNALVILSQPDPTRQGIPLVTRVRSDGSGQYVFDNINRWSGSIRAVHAERCLTSNKSIAVSPGQSSGPDLSLMPGSLVKLSIRGKTGVTPSGTIHLSGSTYSIEGVETYLQELPSGLQKIDIRLMSGERASLELNVPAKGCVDTLVSLSGGVSVTGRAVDVNGKPLENVACCVGPLGSGVRNCYSPRSVFTDKYGQFVISAVDGQENFEIGFSHPEYQDTVIPMKRSLAGTPLLVKLRRADDYIVGRIAEFRQRHPECLIRIIEMEERGRMRPPRTVAVTPGPDGEFRVKVSSDIRYIVTAECADYESFIDTIDGSGDLGEIHLRKPSSIYGSVFDCNGTPIPEFRVGVMAPKAGNNESISWHDMKSPSGRFTIESRFKGRNIVWADAPGYAIAYDTVNCDGSCEEASVVLKNCVNPVIYLMEREKGPIAKASIMLVGETTSYRQPINATTDRDGKAEFSCMEKGKYWARYHGTGIGDGSIDLAIDERPCTLLVKADPIVSGTIVYQNGLPASDIKIAFVQSGPRLQRQSEMNVKDGRFEQHVQESLLVSIRVRSYSGNEIFVKDSIQPGTRNLVITIPELRSWIIQPTYRGRPVTSSVALTVLCKNQADTAFRFRTWKRDDLYRPGDTLQCIANQTYSIEASAKGLRGSLEMTIPSGRDVLMTELPLADVLSLRGQILSEARESVGTGWKVEAYLGETTHRSLTVTTDSLGKFTLNGVLPGNFLIAVYDESRDLRHFGFVNGTSGTVTITLQRPGTISGKVQGERKGAKTNVLFCPLVKQQIVLASVPVTDRDTWGPIELPPGTYLCDLDGRLSRVVVHSDSSIGIADTLPNNLCSMELKACAQPGVHWFQVRQIGGSARFANISSPHQFVGIPSGNYLIEGWKTTHSLGPDIVAFDTVTVLKRKTRHVSCPGAAKMVIIVDHQGTTLSSGVVSVWSVASVPIAGGEVGTDGSCTISGIPRGRYRISFEGRGYAAPVAVHEVRSDSSLDTIRISCVKGCSVNLKTVCGTTSCTPKSVWILDTLDSPIRRKSSFEGGVGIGTLLPGRYRIVVEVLDNQTAMQYLQIKPGQSDTTISLSSSPSGWIECLAEQHDDLSWVVLDEAGNQVPILSTPPRRDGYFASGKFPYVISGLNPGRYTIKNQKDQAFVRTVEVRAGELTTVE